MSTRYNENFQLNPKDIELIEETLRGSLEHLVHDTLMTSDTSKATESDSIDKNKKIKEINNLLGKLHNKKVFYSQTHRVSGVPLG